MQFTETSSEGGNITTLFQIFGIKTNKIGIKMMKKHIQRDQDKEYDQKEEKSEHELQQR